MRNRNRPESRNGSSNDERRRVEDRRGGDRRRPAFDDDRRPLDDRRRNTERRPQDDRRHGVNEERRFQDDKQEDNIYARRNPLADDRRVRPVQQQQSETPERKQNTEESISEEKSIKPVGSASIFDRVRPPPKINRPVPLSEKSKFAYKSESKNKEKDEEYEEYEDEILASSTTTTQKPSSTTTITSTPKPFSFQKQKPTLKPITTSTSSTAAPDIEYYDDEYYDTVTTTPTHKPIESSSIKVKDERASLFNSRVSSLPPAVTSTTAASSPDSFRLNRYKNDNSRENVQQSNLQSFIDPTTTASTSTTTKKPQPSIISNNNNKKYANKQTVFEAVTHETVPVPKASTQGHFQNLYNSRNLEKQEVEIAVEKEQQKPVVRVVKRPFLPSRGGNPYKARDLQPVGVLAEQQTQQDEPQFSAPGIDVRQANENPPRITLEDLYNEEYDVDLNDALNPMLKPLTSSRNVNVNSYSPNSSGDASDKDRLKSQSQKILHKADHYVPVSKTSSSTIATTTSTTPQPEYYDDELEYTYADDVA